MGLDILIDEARNEYAELGTFAVDTYMALHREGLDPDRLARQFQRELENEQ